MIKCIKTTEIEEGVEHFLFYDTEMKEVCDFHFEQVFTSTSDFIDAFNERYAHYPTHFRIKEMEKYLRLL